MSFSFTHAAPFSPKCALNIVYECHLSIFRLGGNGTRINDNSGDMTKRNVVGNATTIFHKQLSTNSMRKFGLNSMNKNCL